MPRMPSAAQPLMMSGRRHCWRTVAVLIDSRLGSGVETDSGTNFLRRCRRRRGRDRIEDAEKSIRISRFVATDQLGEIEIVAGVHAHTAWKAPSHGDLLVLVEQ